MRVFGSKVGDKVGIGRPCTGENTTVVVRECKRDVESARANHFKKAAPQSIEAEPRRLRVGYMRRDSYCAMMCDNSAI